MVIQSKENGRIWTGILLVVVWIVLTGMSQIIQVEAFSYDEQAQRAIADYRQLLEGMTAEEVWNYPPEEGLETMEGLLNQPNLSEEIYAYANELKD